METVYSTVLEEGDLVVKWQLGGGINIEMKNLSSVGEKY